MASARVAHFARWTPLLLAAAAMVCLLAVLLGGRALQTEAAQATPVTVAPSAQTRCGDPAPSRPEPGLQACAAAEKEAEHARPGTPVPPGWQQTLLSAGSATVATTTPTQPAIPARALRSHLSQAPPARA